MAKKNPASCLFSQGLVSPWENRTGVRGIK